MPEELFRKAMDPHDPALEAEAMKSLPKLDWLGKGSPLPWHRESPLRR
jgi:hypothetical protein